MIPKVIHYCWFGGKPLPELAKKCIASWKKYCPDYEIKEWNESNYDLYKNEYMKQAYESKKFAFVPDYARLDIIYNYGGIYLDTDVEIIKPIDDLLEYDGFAGVENNSTYIALGLGFGACKGNPIIKELRDYYDQVSFINEDGTMDLTPAPKLNDVVFQKLGYSYSKKINKVGSLTILPSEYLCPIDMKSGRLKVEKNTYSIHHYAASWCDKKSIIRGKIYRAIYRIFGERTADLAKKIFGKKKK